MTVRRVSAYKASANELRGARKAVPDYRGLHFVRSGYPTTPAPGPNRSSAAAKPPITWGPTAAIWEATGSSSLRSRSGIVRTAAAPVTIVQKIKVTPLK